MRILFLTHYYRPELGAPQTRLHETAKGLQRLGHEVRVLTGPPHYPDGRTQPGYSPWMVRRESVDGVSVVRLPMVPRPNRGFLDRMIDQASFAAAALAATPIVRWSDVVVVESPPLFLGVTAGIHRLASRRPYLFHVADPWPDFPIEMRALHNPLAIRVARAMETFSYRGASLITTVSPGLVALLSRKPGAKGKVRLLSNAVDITRFAPDRSPRETRLEIGWPEARLSLAYVGSVGLAQGLGTLIEAAAPLADMGVVVHVVGEGFDRDRLAKEVAARGLDHIRFEAPISPASVPTVLAAADAVVVMLRRGPLYEHSLPTKLVEGLAAGRPLVVSASGDAADIVEGAGAGFAAAAEDAGALREVILRMALSTEREAMGRRARSVADAQYDRREMVARLASYLADIASADSRRSRTSHRLPRLVRASHQKEP